MSLERESKEEIIEKYSMDVQNLVRFLPWLRQQTGAKVARMYQGEQGKRAMAFPVYDSTLLNFINEAGASVFMDRNYHYIYTRNRIKTYQDEWRAIENATLNSMEILGGILSHYVLGGMTKGNLWRDAVENEIFLRVITKAQEIIEHYDVPMDEYGLQAGEQAEEF